MPWVRGQTLPNACFHNLCNVPSYNKEKEIPAQPMVFIFSMLNYLN